MTIYKYPIKPTDRQTVKMPAGARLLAVQTQRGLPCIWAYVDETAPLVERNIATFVTGGYASVSSKDNHLGTYQLEGGALVFHVFEVGL